MVFHLKQFLIRCPNLTQCVIFSLVILWTCEIANAQRVRLPTNQIPGGAPPAANTVPALGGTPTLPNNGLPGTTFSPNGPVIYGQPRLIGQPQIRIGAPVAAPGTDPFQVTNQFPGGTLVAPPIQGGIQQQAPPYIYPAPNSQPILGTGPGVNPTLPNYNANAPNNSFGNSASTNWPNQAWARLQQVQWYRLFERPRLRYTHIFGNPSPSGPGGPFGDNVNELQIQDVEIATTVNIPNFVWSGLPLRFSPGFVYHFWHGPNFFGTGADLPSRAYSAYLAFDYLTPLNRQVGVELNFTIGVYTDFSHTTSDSIRLTGVGLGWWRFSNVTTLKVGIEYLDRVEVKLLPAFGLFFTPNNNTKFDLYFPRPRIARRIPNWGNVEVWAYLGGEYGGGSWTIRRMALDGMGGILPNIGSRLDINDLRVFVGLEWLGRRNVTGFAEFGYVFDRELLYLRGSGIPIERFKVEDSFMIRAGIAF